MENLSERRRNHTGAFAAKLGYIKVGFASNISKTGFSDQELRSFLNVIDCTFESISYSVYMFLAYTILEIKPYGLGSRIRDVEVFWYKTEIKIINFVFDCVDCVWLYGLPWP